MPALRARLSRRTTLLCRCSDGVFLGQFPVDLKSKPTKEAWAKPCPSRCRNLCTGQVRYQMQEQYDYSCVSTTIVLSMSKDFLHTHSAVSARRAATVSPPIFWTFCRRLTRPPPGITLDAKGKLFRFYYCVRAISEAESTSASRPESLELFSSWSSFGTVSRLLSFPAG